MSAKHTPGPWEMVQDVGPSGRPYFPEVVLVDRADLRYSDGSGHEDSSRRVSRFTVNVGLTAEGLARGLIENTMETCVANARLIAAAPELLEALEGVIGFIDDLAILSGGLRTNGGAQQCLDAARAAIAKARGE
jgi:hypothetical protein